LEIVEPHLVLLGFVAGEHGNGLGFSHLS